MNHQNKIITYVLSDMIIFTFYNVVTKGAKNISFYQVKIKTQKHNLS